MGYEVVEGPEIETEWYQLLGPQHAPRSSGTKHPGFLLSKGRRRRVLSCLQLCRPHRSRSACSSAVSFRIYAVAPGRVYRRDTADASHLPEFHQIEGLVIDKGVSFADLKGTIATFVPAIFGPDVRRAFARATSRSPSHRRSSRSLVRSVTARAVAPVADLVGSSLAVVEWSTRRFLKQ